MNAKADLMTVGPMYSFPHLSHRMQKMKHVSVHVKVS